MRLVGELGVVCTGGVGVGGAISMGNFADVIFLSGHCGFGTNTWQLVVVRVVSSSSIIIAKHQACYWSWLLGTAQRTRMCCCRVRCWLCPPIRHLLPMDQVTAWRMLHQHCVKAGCCDHIVFSPFCGTVALWHI